LFYTREKNKKKTKQKAFADATVSNLTAPSTNHSFFAITRAMYDTPAISSIALEANFNTCSCRDARTLYLVITA